MRTKRITLKQRIVWMFLCSMAVTFAGIFIISNFAITSIIRNKINAGYQSNTKQIANQFSNTINNICHVSQQLAVGDTVLYLDNLVSDTAPYDVVKSLSQIKANMNLIAFTNPNIGLVMYVDEQEDNVIAASGSLSNTIDINALPVLARVGEIAILGPGDTQSSLKGRLVVAASRKIVLSDDREVTLYIESEFHVVGDILSQNQVNVSPLLFVSDQNEIVYSQQQGYTIGESFAETDLSKPQNGHVLFRENTAQGWGIVSLIPTNVYDMERNQWMYQLLILCCIVVAVAVIMALMLWQKIYRPLKNFDREIENVLTLNQETTHHKTGIVEYDHLLEKFDEMRSEVQEMIIRVSTEEKNRANLEIEKLRYQINPHFLMNTLNTVHWMALMNNQSSIDTVVLALNRLLLYNLNKQSEQATIMEELGAITEYLTLQQVRYDFTFEKKILPLDHALNFCCPKFILQPLVENALYHGYRDNMSISINVLVSEERGEVNIDIMDDGIGMTNEKQLELLDNFSNETKISGMGIGLNYVKQMLNHYYDGKASILVDSVALKGTTIHLTLPIKEEKNVTGIDS